MIAFEDSRIHENEQIGSRILETDPVRALILSDIHSNFEALTAVYWTTQRSWEGSTSSGAWVTSWGMGRTRGPCLGAAR